MKKTLMMITAAATVLAGAGCSEATNTMSNPEEIVAMAVDKQEDLKRYYAEAKVIVHEKDQKIEDSVMKEWYDESGAKRRIEVEVTGAAPEKQTVINDGTQIILYTKGAKEAYTTKTDDFPMTMSQRDQALKTLEMLRKTHEIDIAGEEKILGRNTYHIVASPKKKNSLFGELEMWIDQKTWYTLKTISKTGDMEIVQETTSIDFNPSFEKGIFHFNETGVEMKPLEDLNPAETISMEEAEKALGQPLLKINDSAYEASKIEKLFVKSANRTEVMIDYQKNGLPAFSLSVLPTPDDTEMMDGEEAISVRGHQGSYMEDGIVTLTFDEDGLRYVFLSQNPDITKQQLLDLAEGMK